MKSQNQQIVDDLANKLADDVEKRLCSAMELVDVVMRGDEDNLNAMVQLTGAAAVRTIACLRATLSHINRREFTFEEAALTLLVGTRSSKPQTHGEIAEVVRKQMAALGW